MIRKLVLISFLLSALQSPAQFLKVAEVPQYLRDSLENIFPDVKLPAWKKVDGNWRGPRKYEVTFQSDYERKWVLFDSLGRLLDIEVSLHKNNIPKKIGNYLMAEYESWNLIESRKIIISGRNLIFLTLSNGASQKSLLFDEEGTLLAKKSNLAILISSLALSCFIGTIDIRLDPYVYNVIPVYVPPVQKMDMQR